MSRDLRFRVWDKLDRCYKPLAGASFGGQRSKFCGFKYVQLYSPDGVRYDWQVRGEDPMGFEALNGGCSNYKLTDSADADRLVFEQYTGLKDKNGKEIYEGDLIRVLNDEFQIPAEDKTDCAEVIYSEFETGFVYTTWCGRVYVGRHDTSVEVIGNIHENPELFGGKE